MEGKTPQYFTDAKACAEYAINKVGKNVVMGIPLALGKPNQFVNEIYRKAKQDPSIRLRIITALSLEKPVAASELERRIVEPMVARLFGDYPDFEYVLDLRSGGFPDNIELLEFYNKAGGYLNVAHAQQNYISSNYTHVGRDTINLGINVAAQLLSKRTIDGKTMYSLSCNADTPLEVARKMRDKEAQGQKIAIVGQVNTNLPFMYGDAVVEAGDMDAIIDSPDYNFRLFAPPKMPVQTADYMVGLYASTLIQDGGTVQIGIGALGDAIVYGLQLRHKHNETYAEILENAGVLNNFPDVIGAYGGLGAFEEGLYGSTEMFVDGFMHLYRSGIIKRKVYDHAGLQQLVNDGKVQQRVTPETFMHLLENQSVSYKLSRENFDFLQHYGILKENLRYEDGAIHNGAKSYSADLTDESNLEQIFSHCLGTELKHGVVLHGSFFIGPQDFYSALNDMSEEERQLFSMTGVEYVNQLYHNEALKRLQRKKGRFINAGMMVNLFGAVTSDGYEDGRIVSGVGGQYNFVAMAHALDDARGILMIKSTRKKDGRLSSNVVFNYGHTTIPRHLRDIIVTEYGIADLRGRPDKEVAAALLNITDSRFQDGLLQQGKKAKKIPAHYQIPDRFRNNTPEMLEQTLAPYKAKGHFPLFPYGNVLTKEELVLISSLRAFKEDVKSKKISFANIRKAIGGAPEAAKPYLERVQLDAPANVKEKLMQKIVVYALMNANRI